MYMKSYVQMIVLEGVWLLEGHGDSVKNPYMEDFSHTNLCFAQICRF